MINIKKTDLMSEECIQNYQKFLNHNKAEASEKGFYAMENIGDKSSNELFPSVKFIDRRQKEDPTYQGYYALEMLNRRRNLTMFFQNSMRVEWVKYRAANLFEDGLFC